MNFARSNFRKQAKLKSEEQFSMFSPQLVHLNILLEVVFVYEYFSIETERH